MASVLRLLPALALALIVSARAEAPRQSVPSPERARVEFFESRVRPLLVANCYNCHSANTNAKGGLRVDDRNGLIQGGNSGPAVVPGKPEESLLLQAVRHEGDVPKMPPKKRLSPDELAILTRWIAEGAAWPAVAPVVPGRRSNAKYEALRKEHWAWQPLQPSAPPAVRDASWPFGPIDQHLLAALEAKGLRPARDADKGVLIRRVTFDLIGLPPTPRDVDAFIADDSSAAFERVVDRLLASPAFGERWGRHWLDVARYGESTGSSRNIPYPHAWRYRDYVIDAFARDKPYHEFVREQVAGDLLPAHSPAERQEHLVATGFLALGVKDVNQRFRVRFVMDNVDEQIDTVSRALLATTVSCARCHDHKFDPIPQADYYALAGIFRSTDLCAGVRNKMGGSGLDYYDTAKLIELDPGSRKTSASPEKVAEAKKAVAAARAEFQRLQNAPEGDEKSADGRPKRAVARQNLNRLERALLELTDPAANGGQVALGVRDAAEVGDTEIRIRGEAEKLGPVVPRGVLSLLKLPDQPAVNPKQSGRLELARWLTSAQNPLTPRVLVNRVWQHLFGEGLVETVDNFGATGGVPSHPALLDHLAATFVADEWSVKRLVRRIVLSRAYRLDSEILDPNSRVDPANRLVWRHAPRRLDAEEIRDAILAAAGTLDPRRPRGSPAQELKVIELPNNGPHARTLADQARFSKHRSVYLPLLRTLVPTSLEVFDFAEQGMVTGRRDTTTVATQALYLLNDPFVRRSALDLAERLLDDNGLNDEARVQWAYRWTTGRAASASEIARVQQFVADFEPLARELLAQTPAEAAAARPEVIALRDEPSGNGAAATKKPMPPANPDEVIAVDAPVSEEVVRPRDARTAAWAAFCQALFASAEFRNLP